MCLSRPASTMTCSRPLVCSALIQALQNGLPPRLSASPESALLAHHLDQHALSEAAIGDAQPWQRKRIADRIEDGAAGQHQIGALDADAIVGGALLIAHAEQARDGRGDISVAHPDAIDPPAIVSVLI